MATNFIEEEYVAMLKSISGVTDYVGSGANARIYWMSAPEGTITLPYIVVTTIASPNIPPFIGEYGGEVTVQTSVWHDHKRNGMDLALNLRDGIDQYSGTYDSYSIVLLSSRGPVTLQDPDFSNIYQFVVEADIIYMR